MIKMKYSTPKDGGFLVAIEPAMPSNKDSVYELSAALTHARVRHSLILNHRALVAEKLPYRVTCALDVAYGPHIGDIKRTDGRGMLDIMHGNLTFKSQNKIKDEYDWNAPLYDLYDVSKEKVAVIVQHEKDKFRPNDYAHLFGGMPGIATFVRTTYEQLFEIAFDPVVNSIKLADDQTEHDTQRRFRQFLRGLASK